MADVEVFFDPVCPYCWQTSKWVRQVKRLRGLDVRWRFISLRFLNEPIGYGDHPGSKPQAHAQGTRLLRVAADVRESHGDEAVGRLYEALGAALWEVEPPEGGDGEAIRRMHARGLDLEPVLRELALPVEHAAAADRERHDRLLRDETEEALARVGGQLGTPILSFAPPDGPAFFGPVISRLPSDEDAVELWDALVRLANWPGFAELKRAERERPQVRIYSGLDD